MQKIGEHMAKAAKENKEGEVKDAEFKEEDKKRGARKNN